MLVRLVAGGFALALLVGTVSAEDKDKTTTTWEREANGLDLKFEMGKDTLKLSVFNGDNGFNATCTTKTDKDGVVKVTVKESKEKGNFPQTPKAGFEFSFKWKVNGDKAELSDLKGEGLDDAKGLVEGEYKKKK